MKTLQERIDAILKDEKFKEKCEKLRNDSNFENNKKIYEQVAKIKLNDNLLNFKGTEDYTITESQLMNDAISFYKWLDKIKMDSISVNQIVYSNMKRYLTFYEEGMHRSCCASFISPKNGSKIDFIYVNPEKRLRTRVIIIHELYHSIAPSFLGKKHIDKRMVELNSVIIDKIATLYLSEKYPNLKSDFHKEDIFHDIQNIKKSKSALIQSCIVDVVTGRESINSVTTKYGHLFSKDLIEEEVCAIEKGKFEGMYEGRYVISDVVAEAYMEKYKVNPKEMIGKFKDVFKLENDIKLEHAIKHYELPKITELVYKYTTNKNASLGSDYIKSEKRI